MTGIIERKKKIKGKCSALGCWNEVKGSTKFCGSCRCKQSRLKDPVRYSYNNKKNRAKQRKSIQFPNGIPFTISLEYFRQFCFLTGYIKTAGRTIECYDCDRIDETKGYIEGNIQKLKKLNNIKKYHRVKKLNYDWCTRTAKAVDITIEPVVKENEEDYF